MAVKRLWESTSRGVFAICISSVLVASCATFAPVPGMSFEEWKRQAAQSGKGFPELVGMAGGESAYRLTGMTDHNIYYYFQDGRLSKVDQGQIRFQVETVTK